MIFSESDCENESRITRSSTRSCASSDAYGDVEDNVLCKGELWKKRYIFWRHALCTLTWEHFRYTYVGLLKTTRRKIPLSAITGFYVLRCAKQREKDLIVIENSVEPLVLRPNDNADMMKWMDAFRRASTRRNYDVEELPMSVEVKEDNINIEDHKKLKKQMSNMGKGLFKKVASGNFGQIDDMAFVRKDVEGCTRKQRRSALTLRQEFGQQSHEISKTLDCIFNDEDFERLSLHIPWKCRNRRHILLYKMSLHGASLDILYRFVANKGPSILLIQTVKNEVFGAYTSTNWQDCTDGYYGTGECFPFRRLNDGSFEVYRWTKVNDYIMASSSSYLILGGGGDSAIVLNSDFSHGTTAKSTTFNNEPLCQSPFECLEIEIWGFEGLLC